MPGALRHLSYHFDGRAEQLLTIGSGDPAILFVPPLFDEMNRMRRTLVLAMHALAERDIASTLMDLPGANESLAPLEEQSLTRWREAVAAAADAAGIFVCGVPEEDEVENRLETGS